MSAKRPTERQKRAIKEMSENGGIISRAMITAGYSPITAKSPNKLTDSKYFKAQLDLLDEGKYLNRLDEIATSKEDVNASIKAIEMFLKLKNRFPNTKESIDISLRAGRLDIIEPD